MRIENILIDDMGNSLTWIIMGVLEGKTEVFGYNDVKLTNFFNFLLEEKKPLSEYEIADILDEAKNKRTHIYNACKQVPMSQLLYLAEIKGKKSSKSLDMKRYLQTGFCIVGVWIDRVLQKHYRLSIAARTEIFNNMVDWIDSYQKGYLSNKGINEMYIEDIGYDLSKGEKVK